MLLTTTFGYSFYIDIFPLAFWHYSNMMYSCIQMKWITLTLTLPHHSLTEMRGEKGGGSEVNEEIDLTRPWFDPLSLLSTPDPCPGDARHAYICHSQLSTLLAISIQTTGDDIILPRDALCGVVGFRVKRGRWQGVTQLHFCNFEK